MLLKILSVWEKKLILYFLGMNETKRFNWDGFCLFSLNQRVRKPSSDFFACDSLLK